MKKKKAPLSLGPSCHAAAARPRPAQRRRVRARDPGESGARQPVHTVYGGAQLFKFDSGPKLGVLALRAFAEHAPSAGAFSAAIGLQAPNGTPPADFAAVIHARVKAKLEREPVEDYRIDFEDGFGPRSDDEEDAV